MMFRDRHLGVQRPINQRPLARPPLIAVLGGRNKRRVERPSRVGQIIGIAQLAAIALNPVLGRPK